MKDEQDFIQVFEGGHCFLKILYLDGIRSEVEQFSMRVHPFDIFLLNSAFYSLRARVVEGQLRAW